MENKNLAHQRRTKEFWEKAISRVEAGHISVTEFCQSEGISAKTFYYWKGKLKKDATETFLPIRVTSVSKGAIESKADFLEIILRNKRIIRLTSSQEDLGFLARVIRVIEEDAVC